MRLAIVLAVTLCCSTVRAEADPKAMRINGAIFTAVAACLGLVSFSLFAPQHDGCGLDKGCLYGVGLVGGTPAVLALIGAVVGVPLLAVGEHRLAQQPRAMVVPAVGAREAGLNFRMTW